MITKIFRIEGMHCSGCPMEVESIEDDLPGIKKISASYKKAQLVVEYDETQVSDEEIIAAVKQHGYSAAAL